MIGKDEFGNLRLRERRKGGERLCICRYEVIISLWCEELVTDGNIYIYIYIYNLFNYLLLYYVSKFLYNII